MVEDNAVAVNPQRSRINDSAVIRRFHTDVLRNRQVVSQVNLLIDFLAVIDVIPHIGKARFCLGVRLPDERPRPQEPVRGLELQIGKRFVTN